MIRRLKQILNIQSECHSVAEMQCYSKETLKQVQGDKMLLKAFTLAEVLVVIGIIGVVSALTIPNLQQGTNSQEVITKVTKAKATIDEAYGRAIATYGDPCLWTQGQTTATAQAAVWYSRIFENLKLDKECGLVANTNRTCWDSTNPDLGDTYYKVKLADGTSMAMTANTGVLALGYGCGTYGTAYGFYIDIDGPSKGAGRQCDDIYYLGYNITSFLNDDLSGNLQTSPRACAAWVLDKGNADFLKATADSNYFKCKNGNFLNWSNNTTTCN